MNLNPLTESHCNTRDISDFRPRRPMWRCMLSQKAASRLNAQPRTRFASLHQAARPAPLTAENPALPGPAPPARRAAAPPAPKATRPTTAAERPVAAISRTTAAAPWRPTAWSGAAQGGRADLHGRRPHGGLTGVRAGGKLFMGLSRS